MSSATNKPTLVSQMSRAEQEAQNEANRLTAQIDAALAAVAMPDVADSLEAAADRIERAARDLTQALRELAQERKESGKER